MPRDLCTCRSGHPPRADCPRSADLMELSSALAGQGIAVTEHDLDGLVDGAIPLVTEIALTEPPVYIALDRVLLGQVLTHRLTAQEILSDTVAIEPNLVTLSTITSEAPFDQLDDGEKIDQLFVQARRDLATSLDLPQGTLSEFRSGDLVVFKLTEEAFVSRWSNGSSRLLPTSPTASSCSRPTHR